MKNVLSWLLTVTGGVGAGALLGLGLSTLLLGAHHGGGYTSIFIGAPLGALLGAGATAALGAGPDPQRRLRVGAGALLLAIAGWGGFALLVELQVLSW